MGSRETQSVSVRNILKRIKGRKQGKKQMNGVIVVIRTN
jgi:hypothetical protein